MLLMYVIVQLVQYLNDFGHDVCTSSDVNHVLRHGILPGCGPQLSGFGPGYANQNRKPFQAFHHIPADFHRHRFGLHSSIAALPSPAATPALWLPAFCRLFPDLAFMPA